MNYIDNLLQLNGKICNKIPALGRRAGLGIPLCFRLWGIGRKATDVAVLEPEDTVDRK